MTDADFKRIALSLLGAEEGSHMGAVDFRVGGRIFATLASVAEGYGNLMLTPEIQAQFVEDAPDLFLPVAGGWGRMGVTHIRLAKADRDVLTGALRTAWQLRLEKNAGARKAPKPVRAAKAAKAAKASKATKAPKKAPPSRGRKAAARRGGRAR